MKKKNPTARQKVWTSTSSTMCFYLSWMMHWHQHIILGNSSLILRFHALQCNSFLHKEDGACASDGVTVSLGTAQPWPKLVLEAVTLKLA
jgi:hypothetical protein